MQSLSSFSWSLSFKPNVTTNRIFLNSLAFTDIYDAVQLFRSFADCLSLSLELPCNHRSQSEKLVDSVGTRSYYRSRSAGAPIYGGAGLLSELCFSYVLLPRYIRLQKVQTNQSGSLQYLKRLAQTADNVVRSVVLFCLVQNIVVVGYVVTPYDIWVSG